MDEREYLENYDISKYERPSFTVDILVFAIANEKRENYRRLSKKSLRLLLIKRGEHPFKGQWALPGGFVRANENIDATARRELKEETNVEHAYLEQLHTWGDLGRDPRGWIISTSYMALVNGDDCNIESGDDADEARWFEVNYKVINEEKVATDNGYRIQSNIELVLTAGDIELKAILEKISIYENHIEREEINIIESRNIAFDHPKMIEYGLDSLRKKVEQTDIVFSLMPELFTLTELQKVYEIILGKSLLMAAFRRKLTDIVIETEEFTKDAGHRPSRLHRFNNEWRF